MNKTTVTRPFQDVTTELQINLGFWETDHPPLPLVNIITSLFGQKPSWSDVIYISDKGASFDERDSWESDHPPLPLVNIITYFPLRANCWLREGVGGQFPRNLIDPT